MIFRPRYSTAGWIHRPETSVEDRLVLDTLEDSPHLFYLTGSRFFGTARSNSDWDFFCQNTPEAQDWLQKNDFKIYKKAKHYLQDPSIYQLLVQEKVQVQLVTDAKRKMRAQDLLHWMPRPAFLAFLETPKNRQAEWWGWALGLSKSLSSPSQPS